jgi:xanthosine utilization system XapX-like protein
LVLSQLGPTVLLISTVALLQFGLAQTDISVRIAAAGILLASGILGALVQFQVASETQELSRTSGAHTSSANWMWVVKYVTPTIFVGIYLALMVAFFA